MKITNTFVISAFPGCGKTYCYENYQDKYSILDSDSSEFSWMKDESGANTKERNPDFHSNYIRHIKDNIGKVDIIFVSSHEAVRKALHDSKIQTVIIYPHKSLKKEWIRRFTCRGNNSQFIEFISNNWDGFIDSIENETYGFLKERLSCNSSYISLDYLDGLYDNSMGNMSWLWMNS